MRALRFLLLFGFLLGLSSQADSPLIKTHAPSQLLGTWKSSCTPTKNRLYARTYTNFRKNKSIFFRINYQDPKCETPLFVLKIRAAAKVKKTPSHLSLDLKYRQVAAACVNDRYCELMAQNHVLEIRDWKSNYWHEVDDHFTKLLSTSLHTLLAVQADVLYYGHTNRHLNGRTRGRRPSSIDGSKYDRRTDYLPVFLTSIR